MKHITKESKGQSLIEIVVAVGIIVVVLVGVADLISRALNLASYNAGKNTATNIAQSQLTYYRHARDLEPTRFFQDPNPQAGFDQCVDNPDDTKYICSINYDNTDLPNGTKMTVNIEWVFGGKTINTSLSQELSKLTK